MATSASDPSARNDIELPPVTNWPLIRLAAILGGIVVVGIVGIILLAATQMAPPEPVEAVAAMRPAPPPRSADQMVVKPAAPVDAAPSSLEPALWKPLVPPAAPVAPPPAVKPIIQQPDLIAVLDPAPLQPPAPIVAVRESEARFSKELQTAVRQLDLDTVAGSTTMLLGDSGLRRRFDDDKGSSSSRKTKAKDGFDTTVVDVIAHRSDLAGLPVRNETEFLASEESAKALQELSTQVRRAQARADRLDITDKAADPGAKRSIRDKALISAMDDKNGWLKDEYALGLAQMLCVEAAPVRLQLTKMLAATKGRRASVALARQALFDQSPQVRHEAIQSLKDRPRQEYRQTLLDGFRYPLPAVADRAAQALVEVGDRGAASDLTKLLDLPDPAAPGLNDKKQWVVAEVVKVNHLRNCLLCHAPAGSDKEHVPGFVPKPGQEIPVAYYAQVDGDFVRADVTYLRQDFSMMESVPDPDKWPAQQRFDYMIRQRQLSDEEIVYMTRAAVAPSRSYPQREAVRFALEKLSSPDPVAKPGLGP